MQWLLVRHAIAVPSGTPGIPDDERPLTAEGEKRFRRAARGLARLVPRPDAILSSPLPRALRTAQLAAAAWGRLRVHAEPALATDQFADWETAVSRLGPIELVALVGHEPHLSMLLAQLLGSARAERFAFKKGGVAWVEVPGALAAGGTLLGIWPPAALRELS